MSLDIVAPRRHPAHETVVQLIRELTRPYTVAALADLVRAGTVPDGFIPLALHYIDREPSLMSLSDVQFRLAAAEARPELGALFDSPVGRRWAEKLALTVAASLPGHWLRGLFGR